MVFSALRPTQIQNEVQSRTRSPWTTSNPALSGAPLTTTNRTSRLCTANKSTPSLKPKQEQLDNNNSCRKTTSHQILSIRQSEGPQKTSSSRIRSSRLLRSCQRARVEFHRRAHASSFLSRPKLHGRKGTKIVAKCHTATGSLWKTPPAKMAYCHSYHNSISSRIKIYKGMPRMPEI